MDALVIIIATLATTLVAMFVGSTLALYFIKSKRGR